MQLMRGRRSLCSRCGILLQRFRASRSFPRSSTPFRNVPAHGRGRPASSAEHHTGYKMATAKSFGGYKLPTAAEYAGCRDSRVRKRFDLVGNNEKRDDPNLLSHPVFHIGRGNPVEEFSETVAQTEAHAVLQRRIPGGDQISHVDVHSGEAQAESH